MIEDYYTSLNNSNLTLAYDAYSVENKMKFSYKGFERLVKNWGGGTLLSGSVIKNVCGEYAIVEIEVGAFDQKGVREQWKGPVHLVQEEGDWKIYRMIDLEKIEK